MRDPDIDQLAKQKERLYEELSALPVGSRKFRKVFKSYLSVFDHLKFYIKTI